MGGCSGPLSDNDFVSFDIIASLNLGFIGMKDSIWEFEFMVLNSFHILAQLWGESGAFATNDILQMTLLHLATLPPPKRPYSSLAKAFSMSNPITRILNGCTGTDWGYNICGDRNEQEQFT